VKIVVRKLVTLICLLGNLIVVSACGGFHSDSVESVAMNSNSGNTTLERSMDGKTWSPFTAATPSTNTQPIQSMASGLVTLSQ
jgi:hypothetical protein